MLADVKEFANENDIMYLNVLTEGFNALCGQIEAEEEKLDQVDLSPEEKDKISVAQLYRYFNMMRNLKSGLVVSQSMALNPECVRLLQIAIGFVENTYISPMLSLILENANLPRDEKELLVVVKRL